MDIQTNGSENPTLVTAFVVCDDLIRSAGNEVLIPLGAELIIAGVRKGVLPV